MVWYILIVRKNHEMDYCHSLILVHKLLYRVCMDSVPCLSEWMDSEHEINTYTFVLDISGNQCSIHTIGNNGPDTL